jgi:DHA3 family tetracycline resistance protein-like MFS transporter
MIRLVRPLPATTVYLITKAAASFGASMVFVASGVYLVTVVGLNPLQLVLTGTALEVAVFLFEVPTGVVADVYSRRLSIIIGMFIMSAGFVLWGAVPIFGVVLAAQLIWGLGHTFTSGADAAWIADEVGERRVTPIYLRGAQARQLGSLCGIALGAALGTLRINLPMILGGLVFTGIGVFMLLFMPEEGFARVPTERRTTWESLARTLHHGVRLVRLRPILFSLLAIGLLHGMASEAFDRLWDIHFLRNFTLPGAGSIQPVVWFGIIDGGVLLFSLAATEIVRRRLAPEPGLSLVRALVVVNALIMAAMIAFALARSFTFAVAAYWAAHVLRQVNDPLYTARLNQGLTPEVRATVHSMAGQSDAVGQIAGGPILGIVANTSSIRTALAVSGAILSPVLLLYTRAFGRAEGAGAPADKK